MTRCQCPVSNQLCKREAAHYCETCSMNLCQVCVEVHVRKAHEVSAPLAGGFLHKKHNESVNAFLFKIGERAKVLADAPIDQLRRIVGTQDTPEANVREMRHRKRGDMIEEILTEEFHDDAVSFDEALDK